jgi:hypothetical protein
MGAIVCSEQQFFLIVAYPILDFGFFNLDLRLLREVTDLGNKDGLPASTHPSLLSFIFSLLSLRVNRSHVAHQHPHYLMGVEGEHEWKDQILQSVKGIVPQALPGNGEFEALPRVFQ